MRILLIDVDSLRPDHLGCYGYDRATSPTVDALAEQGLRFTNVYASDAPCLPSRTSLATGRLGIHHGAVGHGGARAEPYPLGDLRGFRAPDSHLHLFQVLDRLGIRSTSISPFPTRHAAWWFLAGLSEWIDPGKMGDERADEINAHALPWLERHAAEDDWLLHLNYWDPHTVYRTPLAFGNPFADDPGPSWLTQEQLEAHRASYGPMSARDGSQAWFGWSSDLPWVPKEIATLDDVKGFVDGYDAGVRWFDDHLTEVLDLLATKNVLDDTLIVVTADHGENLGELNVYGDHQTADQATCRLPMIVRWPGRIEPGRDDGLHYHVDVMATLVELLGAEVPDAWDGTSFATSLATDETTSGRDEVILSQMAWSCQRSVRWDRWILIRTYHPGLKDFDPIMLFDLEADPHQTSNLADKRSDVVREGLARLERWRTAALATSGHHADPLHEVLRNGGPFHTRGALGTYLDRLRETDRGHLAAHVTRQHDVVEELPLDDLGGSAGGTGSVAMDAPDVEASGGSA